MNVGIIQARTGSSRLPGKIMMKTEGKTMLEHMIERVSKSKKLDKIVIATTTKENDDVINFSKKLCMHIAASKPEAIDIDKLPSDLIESEKKIQEEMIKDSGKPSNVMEKILEGKMKKFYSEVTLLNQSFVIDTDKTVKEAINDFNVSNSLTLKNYILISV